MIEHFVDISSPLNLKRDIWYLFICNADLDENLIAVSEVTKFALPCVQQRSLLCFHVSVKLFLHRFCCSSRGPNKLVQKLILPTFFSNYS